MTERVLDEIPDRLLEPEPVPVEGCLSRLDDHGTSVAVGATCESRRDVMQQGVEIECVVTERELPFVEAGE